MSDYKQFQAENKARLKQAKQGTIVHESIVTIGGKRVGVTFEHGSDEAKINNSNLDNEDSKP